MYYENLFRAGRGASVRYRFFIADAGADRPAARAEKSNVDYAIRRTAYPAAGCLLGGDGLCTAGLLRVLGAERQRCCCASAGAYFTSHISTAANREMGLLLAFVRTPQLYMLLPVMNVTLSNAQYHRRAGRSPACIARYQLQLARKNQNKTILGLYQHGSTRRQL